jgi:hypothetical protein
MTDGDNATAVYAYVRILADQTPSQHEKNCENPALQ